MNKTIVILATLVVLGTIPGLASANHFSVGGRDGVGIQPAETAATPSVPRADGSGNGLNIFERGTSTTDAYTGGACYDPTGTTAAASTEVQDALQKDPFCGRLVYNAGTTEEQTSTEDQDYPAADLGLEFDVIKVSYVGAVGLGWCPPFWCLPATAQAMQNTMDAAGIGDDFQTYRDGAGSETENQGYHYDMHYPSATLAATQATGLWEANGWAATAGGLTSYVGFLTENGATVDDERLTQIVEAEQQAGRLGSGAANGVCAFTPDSQISISAAQVSFCEVTFTYTEEEGGSSLYWDSYGDSCGSPSYMCGVLTEAWYANLVQAPTSGGATSTYDYEIWHFVVAPTQSGCNGVSEPGFSFSSPGDGSIPYLAHDLDIFEHVTDVAGSNQLENVMAWDAEFEDQNVDPVVDQVSGAASLQLAETTQYTLVKDRVQEPNTAKDDIQALLGDTTLDRNPSSDICDQLAGSNEQNPDQWVDYMDSWVWQDLFAAGLTPVSDNPLPDQDHDASNTGAPSRYYISGYVGMFTDKNDDGEYDQAAGESVYADINTVGAYPLLFDMWATWDNGALTVNQQGGCQPGFGSATDRLAGHMAQAGYGAHTGLIQAIHLEEPTVLFHDGRGEVLPFLGGGNTFVFLSQALRVGYDNNDPVTLDLIQDALDELDVSVSVNDVIVPGTIIGTASDFFDQCRADTGDYSIAWTFTHACQAGCAGDSLVTMYVAELTNSDGSLGGGPIPVFEEPDSTNAYDFSGLDDDGDGIIEIIDYDPFDGDASKNTGPGNVPPN